MLTREKDTPPPETVRGGGSPAPGPVSDRDQWLGLVWGDVRRGAGHFHQRSVPLPVNRLAQLVHGLCLPFHLVRTALADPQLRRRYLGVSVLQVAAIVGLAVLITGSGKEVVETVGPEEWMEEQQVEAQHKLAEAQVEQEETKARLEREQDLDKAAEGAARLAQLAGSDQQEQVRVAVKQALKDAHAAEEHRRAAGDAVGKELERPVRKRTVHWVVYWAALLSSLQLAQWIVIALSRDFHTVIEREVSLRTGVTPEDEPLTPRIRLNVAWLRGKMKRRWRALVVFGFGAPVLWCLTWFLPWKDSFFTLLMSLWGTWWFVVYTAAKSSLAWSEQAPREPWFLRGWNWLTSRIAPLRWAMFNVYGSMWTNQTREVFAPAASVERRPWGLMGLSVVRALAALPLVKCFLRPIIPVAAAHLLLAEQSARQSSGSSVPGGA